MIHSFVINMTESESTDNHVHLIHTTTRSVRLGGTWCSVSKVLEKINLNKEKSNTNCFMKMDPPEHDSSDDSGDNVPLKDLMRIKNECMEFEAEEEQFTATNIKSSQMTFVTHETTTATPTSEMEFEDEKCIATNMTSQMTFATHEATTATLNTEIESYNQNTMQMHTDGENVFFLKPESLVSNFDAEDVISTTIVKKLQPERQLQPISQSISRNKNKHKLCESDIRGQQQPSETCSASDFQCDSGTGKSNILIYEDFEDSDTVQLRKNFLKEPIIKSDLDEALLEWLIGSLQNHQILNSLYFNKFIEQMAPSYRLPAMEKISQKLFMTYQKNLRSLKTFVSSEARSVCISVETWTTWQSEVYQSVMAHFLATSTMELKSVLLDVCWLGTDSFNVNDASFAPRDILDSWNLHGKVNLVVYDGSDVIADAYKMCIKDSLLMKCYAKTLSDIVKTAMAPFKKITKKLRFLAIVWHSVKRDENIEEDLSGFDASIESPTWLYILYIVVNRFDDVCARLKTYQETENIIYKHVLTKEELQLCKEFYEFIKPFEEIVRFISSKKYLTAGVPIPMTCVLLKVLTRMQVQPMYSQTGLEVLNQLFNGIKDLVPVLESNRVLRLCTFLDPRFKGLFFSKIQLAESVKKSVQRLIVSNCKDNKKPSNRVAETNSVWPTFEVIANETMNEETAACREIEKYLACDTAPRTSSPLLWWNDNREVLPNLLKVFYDNYGAVASCAPCQNFFTANGKRANVQRSQLHKDYLREVLFINVNKSMKH